MFAKGANYIPQDALLPNVTTERYQTLFRDMKEANMNMVRIWGGGTYENNLFYDLADENGIPVSYTHLDVYKRQKWWLMSVTKGKK